MKILRDSIFIAVTIAFLMSMLTFSTSCINKKQKDTADSIIANMVKVDGGTFMMGTNEYKYDYQQDQSPAHQVTVKTFYICKYEVTQQEWEAIMGKNPSDYKDNGPKCPVESVSWLDCQEFIRRLNELTGKKFRLPTEAEWEFAARGGNKTHGYIFSGSEDPYQVGRIYTQGEGPQQVGLLNPNELGLYDMSGNINEFCADAYAPYNAEPQTNPLQNDNNSVYRVARGGGFCNARRNCTVTARLQVAKQECYNGVGLRLVMEAE